MAPIVHPGGTFVTRSEMEAAQVLKDISSIVKNSKDSCFRGMIGLGHLLLPLFLAALDIISTAAALLLSAYLRFDVIVPENI